MDRQFSNATSSLASAALILCTELANYWRTVLADQGSFPIAPSCTICAALARSGARLRSVCAIRDKVLGFWKWSGITAPSRRKFQGTP